VIKEFIKRINKKKALSYFLVLVCLHSFSVGIILIFANSSFLNYLGFDVLDTSFFQMQGGVFHLVMSVCYGLAALEINKFRGLIILSITAKFIATTFLFIYYVFIESIWIYLLAGLGDFSMGIVILVLLIMINWEKKSL